MAEDRVQGRSAENGFAALGLDRQGDRRKDAAWVAERFEAPDSRFYPVWGVRSLVTAAEPPRAAALSRAELGGTLDRAESVVFLGTERGHGRFAVGFAGDGSPPDLPSPGRFVGLRGAAPLLPAADAALFAYARAMVTWHRTARFCGGCGAPTESGDGGFVRRCTDPECGREHFPRTDPAIIVLVHRGGRCLLGRQAAWDAGRHSVIAGYLEPGETFEAAVAREVFEETGVEVEAAAYRSSQPWPFPGGIMVGFHARAVSEGIELRDGELESARWLDRGQLSRELRAHTLSLPYPVSIAYHLIREWFDAAPGWRLADAIPPT